MAMETVLEYVKNHPHRAGVKEKDQVLMVRAFQVFHCPGREVHTSILDTT